MSISLTVLIFKNYKPHLLLSHSGKGITHWQGPSRPVVTPPFSAVWQGPGYLDSSKSVALVYLAHDTLLVRMGSTEWQASNEILQKEEGKSFEKLGGLSHH